MPSKSIEISQIYNKTIYLKMLEEEKKKLETKIESNIIYTKSIYVKYLKDTGQYKGSLFEKEVLEESIISYILPEKEKSDTSDKYSPKKCEHNKIRSRCKDCKGASVCPHGLQKYYCKECKGTGICKHNKQKSNCIECGGSAYCLHKKFKRNCKECKSPAFCIHDKRKSICIECNGSELCIHKKFKANCRICNIETECENKILRYKCDKCRGSAICIHAKRKAECKSCKGSQICKHDKVKKFCSECDGSSICKHKKQKPYCKECGGSALCITPFCETVKLKKYRNHCFRCFVLKYPDEPNSKNYKTKEMKVVDFIKKTYPEKTIISDKRIEDGCSKRRPDLFLDLGNQIIIIEIDENQHMDYDCSCENKRLMEISKDVDHRPIVFIRFNPDAYNDKEGNKVTSCWSYNNHMGLVTIKKSKEKEWNFRLDCLKQQIDYWIENKTEKTIEIIQLFFDENLSKKESVIAGAGIY